MAALKRISIALALVALAFSSVNVATAANQLPLGNIDCSLATVPNSIRAEGIAERVGDTRLDCINNGSRDDGDTDYQQYIPANFRLIYNANVTSMIHLTGSGGPWTEALLIINDNNSLDSETTSVFPSVCDAPDDRYPCPQLGVLLTPTDLIWDGVEVPVPAAPNDLGDLNVDDDTDFNSAPFDADTDFDCDLSAGDGDPDGCFNQTTTLRFTNVRINATSLAVGGAVTVQVNISSSFAIGIIGSRTGDVADAFIGLISMLGDTFAGLQCEEEEGTASVELWEGFATAFKTIGVPTFLENQHSAENGYPVDGSGTATQATQFVVRLTGLPEGVDISMPSHVHEIGTFAATGHSDSHTAGACPAPGSLTESPPDDNGDHLCIELISSDGPDDGVAEFVYRVMTAHPFKRQHVEIDIGVSWTPDTDEDEPEVTSGSVDVSFHPISDVFVADEDSPKPRFIDSNNDPAVFVTVTRCTTTLLYPFVTSTFGLDTGIAVSNTSVDWKGTAAQRGACTMHFIGKTLGETGFGDVEITEQTSVILEGGEQLAFSLLLANPDQGIDDPVPDFQGFIVAMCDFQFAHGYAFITDGASGFPTLAQGYLALIMQFDESGDRLLNCHGTGCKSEALNQ